MSCSKPGTVIWPRRTAPPGVGCSSHTTTSRPAPARTLAATSPFGPAPVTTTSQVTARYGRGASAGRSGGQEAAVHVGRADRAHQRVGLVRGPLLAAPPPSRAPAPVTTAHAQGNRVEEHPWPSGHQPCARRRGRSGAHHLRGHVLDRDRRPRPGAAGDRRWCLRGARTVCRPGRARPARPRPGRRGRAARRAATRRTRARRALRRVGGQPRQRSRRPTPRGRGCRVRRRCGRAACAVLSAPARVMSTVRRNSPGSISVNGPYAAAPALATTASRPPSAAAASSTTLAGARPHR